MKLQGSRVSRVIVRMLVTILLCTTIITIIPQVSIVFQPLTASAATSHIWCVRLGSGVTSAPCTNADAFPTIQSVLNYDVLRSGDEIRIAAGTYTSDYSSDLAVAVLGRVSPLTLRGGYQNNNWSVQGPPTATVIDGRSFQRGISIQGDVAIALIDLTVTNGKPDNINALGIDNLLILDTVIVSKSQANGIAGPNTTVLRNSQIIDNANVGLLTGAADIDGSLFQHNGAGGLRTSDAFISDSRFIENTSFDGGGAYIMRRGWLENTDFIGNRSNGNGGGLYLDQHSSDAQVDINGGSFINNSAFSIGGGLSVVGGLIMTGTQIIDNSAGVSGGGISIDRYQGPARITNTLIKHNTANQRGGGILMNGDITLFNIQVVENTAGTDGGGIANSPATGSSGFARNTQISISAGLIANNQATNNGGGIYVSGGATLTLGGTEISDNQASFNGGGLAEQYDGSITGIVLAGGIFKRNIAQQSGGGAFIQGNLTAQASQFISNTAGLNGGGLHAAGETAQLIGVLLGDNRARGAADALYVDTLGAAFPIENAQVSLVNCTVASALLAPHAAIQIPGTAANITLTNTIVTSHTVGITRTNGSTLTGSYNDFFGNSTDQKIDSSATPPGFSQSLSSRPGFVNAPAHNFHLLESSPLINAGDPGRAYSGQLDMEGQIVPADGRADIGADEFYKYRYVLPLVRR